MVYFDINQVTHASVPDYLCNDNYVNDFTCHLITPIYLFIHSCIMKHLPEAVTSSYHAVSSFRSSILYFDLFSF